MLKHIIVAFREGEPDRHCVLDEGESFIGRAPESAIMLPDPTVSRRHALLRLVAEAVSVEDLDSANGVFLNGERVTTASLQDGDFLSVGAYMLVLRVVGSAEVAAAPKGKTLCIGYDASRRLHEESLQKHSPKYLMALYRAALLFGDSLPPKELLEKVLRIVVEALSARRGTIVVCREERTAPEVVASVYEGNPGADPIVSKRLLYYVLNAKMALLTEDAQGDPRFGAPNSAPEERGAPAMCVPLCGATRVGGVLYVDAAPEAPRFAETDLEFLSAVGHVVGVLVENRLLSDKVSKQERLAVLGQAIAGIAHDVRNLLAGIKVGVEMMEYTGGRTGPGGADSPAIVVKKSVDQVEDYLTGMLTFLRESEIRRAPTALHDLVQDAVECMMPYAEERNVRLVFRGGGFEHGEVDALQLHRVLVNLIKNAIEACEGRGGLVRVSIGRKADTLMIQVSDTGTGIKPEDIPRLSEPFFSTKKKSGTGLGLALSYHIVEKHGGHIAVKSELGQGAAFTVIVPNCFRRELSTAETIPPPAADDVYKKCPTCGVVWPSQEAFLSDPNVELAGYQVHFEELTLGLFMFGHACGTTLAIPAGDFRHLYDGPIFRERMTGTAECPGYCLQKAEKARCAAKCECAYVREVLQIIGKWPKA